jgi:hypothetical protein
MTPSARKMPRQSVKREQLPAHHRADHRRQAADQHQLREHHGRPRAVVHVAHHRPGDHHRGGAGQALHQPEGEQQPDVGDDGAEQ